MPGQLFAEYELTQVALAQSTRRIKRFGILPIAQTKSLTEQLQGAAAYRKVVTRNKEPQFISCPLLSCLIQVSSHIEGEPRTFAS